MTMKNASLTMALASVLILSSCGTANKLTRGQQYQKMYDETPLTILVMPPINQSSYVEAKELFYTSINQPLIEFGYYVISPNLVLDMLKSESAYDSELFVEGDQSIFNRTFGADAVVYTYINEWRKKGFSVRTSLRYLIKSTHTNVVLFDRNCELKLDTKIKSGGSSALSMLVDLAATAINTALTEHIVAARECNYYVLRDIPRGQYSPEHLKDKDVTAEPQSVKATVK